MRDLELKSYLLETMIFGKSAWTAKRPLYRQICPSIRPFVSVITNRLNTRLSLLKAIVCRSKLQFIFKTSFVIFRFKGAVLQFSPRLLEICGDDENESLDLGPVKAT